MLTNRRNCGVLYDSLLVACLDSRQFHEDAGSFPGKALDTGPAAEQPCPLANPLQSEAPVGHSIRVESHSLVFDLEQKCSVPLPQPDLGRLRPAVPLHWR